jgi:hypothetical protein
LDHAVGGVDAHGEIAGMGVDSEAGRVAVTDREMGRAGIDQEFHPPAINSRIDLEMSVGALGQYDVPRRRRR